MIQIRRYTPQILAHLTAIMSHFGGRKLLINPRMSLAAVINIAILITFWIISYAVGDPHLFQRSGALVAAVAALLVILQLVDELQFEEQRKVLEHDRMKAGLPVAGTPDVEFRVRQKIYRSRVSALARRRIGTAFLASVCACLGELVHGYGDLLVPTAVLAH